MAETSNKFLSKLKRIGLEIFAFLTSKIFIKNFVGILGMLAVFFFFTSMWLKCYTDHGEILHMDTFKGLHLDDAKELAEQNNYTLVVDSISNTKIKPLTIIKQHPKPNAPVKENRTVYITVVKQARDMKRAPTLVGNNEDFNIYRKQLERGGLKARKIEEKYSRLEPNTILEILHNGDTLTDQLMDGEKLEFPEGTELQFIVSKKGIDNVEVPDIMCKTFREAQFILENNDLNFGSIIRDQTVTNKGNAYIWKQEPQIGSLRFGAQVDVWITQNFPDGCDGLLNPLEAPREEATTPPPVAPVDTTSIEDDEEEDFNN